MTAARQDAWTADEDLLLAELVLAHIRDGSTQLQAFEEAGKKLRRTAAACGFRWNSNIRKQYKTGIEFAKKQRSSYKKGENAVEVDHNFEENKINIEESDTEKPVLLSDAMQFFKKLESELASIEKYKQENDRQKDELTALKAENGELVKRNAEINENYEQLREEYRSLINLLNKASKMADVLTDKNKVNSEVMSE